MFCRVSPRVAGAGLAALLPLTATLALPSGLRTADPRPLVYAAEVDSIIHPVSAPSSDLGPSTAPMRIDASLLVFTLRTPGGLVDSTQSIV